MLLALAGPAVSGNAETLTQAPTRDQKVIRRWSLPGSPRGMAVGKGGVVYVGLAQQQAVVAIDAKTGAVLQRAVLDSAEIAATKELVTLRLNREGSRLYVANGSDESATILTVPDLRVIREITIEGEPIRDVLPDPSGRYLYLLGRHLHVFDAEGKAEVRRPGLDDPMAVALSSDGMLLALVGSEDFGTTRATVVALYETTNVKEVARGPLQTDRRVNEALFAAGDRALIAIGPDHLYEKPLMLNAAPRTMETVNGQMRTRISFGDLVNSERVCLPENSGAQIAVLATSELLLFAERRCSSSGAFSGSARRVVPVSLYGVAAYAVGYDRETRTLCVTDPAGSLTIYRVPSIPVVK